MVIIDFPEEEVFNEDEQMFVTLPALKGVVFVHSLKAVMRWEQKYKKPFLSQNTKNLKLDEVYDYFRCMANLTSEELPNLRITAKHVELLQAHINDEPTATVIKDMTKGGSTSYTTAETIYANMVQLGVPFHCDEWPLFNLLTLLRVIAIKSNPEGQKMSRNDIYKQNAKLNAQRRAMYKSRG